MSTKAIKKKTSRFIRPLSVFIDTNQNENEPNNAVVFFLIQVEYKQKLLLTVF